MPPQEAARADTSLWAFSVSIYGRPGAAEECLSLQDRFGVNVNILLFSLYAASEFGALLSRDDICTADRAVAHWQTKVVEALRKVRRLLKQSDLRCESLLAQVADAELEAERMEAALLMEWCNARIAVWPRRERDAAIVHNCRSVLSYYGAGPQIDLPQRLISLAIAAAGP
ncbi:MAG TPA: TIGR02444 family protein [Steroidobacteraceae bacterium]|nr:TIGR02444 family protein [Steroidobacteraceae bacterium]